ncbi:MAG: hypothetical protein JO161_08100 [Planctomycetaceae bacterium]|nr:hypothetical protein [Planctomycetaceae bacterium]
MAICDILIPFPLSPVMRTNGAHPLAAYITFALLSTGVPLDTGLTRALVSPNRRAMVADMTGTLQSLRAISEVAPIAADSA